MIPIPSCRTAVFSSSGADRSKVTAASPLLVRGAAALRSADSSAAPATCTTSTIPCEFKRTDTPAPCQGSRWRCRLCVASTHAGWTGADSRTRIDPAGPTRIQPFTSRDLTDDVQCAESWRAKVEKANAPAPVRRVGEVARGAPWSRRDRRGRREARRDRETQRGRGGGSGGEQGSLVGGRATAEKRLFWARWAHRTERERERERETDREKASERPGRARCLCAPGERDA